MCEKMLNYDIRFKKAVDYIVENNYNAYLAKLVKNKIDVGLFIPVENITPYSDIIKELLNCGINLTYVILLNNRGNINIGCCKVINIMDFDNVRRKPNVIFMLRLNNSNFIVDEYFRNKDIRTITLSNTTDSMESYKIFLEHIMDLYEIYNMLDDELSKKSFLCDIIGAYTKSYNEIIFASEPQYMLKGYMPEKGDIAIDGGAYDGETGFDFFRLGAVVHSFELDENNYRKTKATADHYGFTSVNKGLGSEEGTINYTALDRGSFAGKSGESIGYIIDIDTYVKQNDLLKVDYIKMDIEGSELEALKGAYNMIAMFKPKMAISAYHKECDIWTLAQYIKSLRSDYVFAWRHYPISVGEWLGDEYISLANKLGISGKMASDWEKVLYCR